MKAVLQTLSRVESWALPCEGGFVLQSPGEVGAGDGEKTPRVLRPPPALTHSLTEDLTLDKQLQSIYLGPYGGGEQVCGNEEPSSN